MISKKTVRKLASVFIVGLLAAIFTVNSFAIEYGGTSGEGGQSTSSGGGRYSIEENNGVCGYRFTMVDSDGVREWNTNTVDVLCKGYSKNEKASRAWRFHDKHPKTWWIGNVNTKFDWTQNNNYVVVDSDYGLSLPTDTKQNEGGTNFLP